MNSETKITTESASRYLQQLCKHFSHKVPTEFEATHGSITLPMGVCQLDATDSLLTMRASASDDQDLTRLQGVMANHLKRFAFREEFQIEWAQAVEAQASPA